MMAIAGVRRSFLVLPIVSLLVAATSLAIPEFAASAVVAPQYGINVYVTDNCGLSSSAWKTNATNEMQGIKSLGANSVAIAFGFYTKGPVANSVFTADLCSPGNPVALLAPNPARLAVLVHAAKVLGLRVTLRPLMEESNLGVTGRWRGSIVPANKTTWFTSYKAFLKPYLQMAQANGVFRFGISGELISLQTSTQWASVITYAKSLYSGQLVSDYTWRAPGSGGVANTFRGADAYPPLTGTTPSSSVATLLSKWNALLKTHPIAVTTTLDEVGISAVNGAYATPWINSYPGATFNQTIQANWFKTACQFFKAHKFAGLYFWGPQFRYNNGKLLTTPDPQAASELQPAGLAAIRACF